MNKLILRALPRASRSRIRCLDILENQLGHALSRKRRECCDHQGGPIPWYTYSSLEYIRQIDWSEKRIFEFGSGNSTRFWGAQAKSVVAIEHDRAWYEQIRQRVGANVQIQWAQDGHHYVEAIAAENKLFDLIVVDGEFRAKCAENALKFLRNDGAILLDNSDWHPEAASILREADLIEVDFFGFGPINDYTWTTSLFLTREFRPKFRSPRHPLPGPGSLNNRATTHSPY